MGQVNGKAQLNVLLPTHIQRTVRLRWISDGVSPAETVLHALCETYGWPREDAQPIDGQMSVEQLTVDETQTDESSAPQTGLAGRRTASRRPRAAEQAERTNGRQASDENAPEATEQPGTVDTAGGTSLSRPGDAASPGVTAARGGPPAETSAGCPECGDELFPQEGVLICAECGYRREDK